MGFIFHDHVLLVSGYVMAARMAVYVDMFGYILS